MGRGIVNYFILLLLAVFFLFLSCEDLYMLMKIEDVVLHEGVWQEEEEKEKEEEVPPVILLNIYDKDTGAPLNSSTLQVLETGFSTTIGSNTYELTLDKGNYNILIAKANYRARSYVLRVDKDLTINVMLKSKTPLTTDYENISGIVQDEGVALTTKEYYISSGVTNINDITPVNDLTGNFSVSSVCGELAIAAFTKDDDQKLEKLVYETGQTLSLGNPIQDLVFNFVSSNMTTYSGTKPLGGDLHVKLATGHILADQKAISGDNSYGFKIDLLAGDSITLESRQRDEYDCFFVRKVAGTAGGSHDLDFGLGLPAMTVTEKTEYYGVDFAAVTGADFYESYVLELDNYGDPTYKVHVVVLAGHELRIPKTLLDADAAATIFYQRAIKLAGFSQEALLEDTLTLAEYEYSETGSALTISQSISGIMDFKSIHNNNYLLLED